MPTGVITLSAYLIMAIFCKGGSVKKKIFFFGNYLFSNIFLYSFIYYHRAEELNNGLCLLVLTFLPSLPPSKPINDAELSVAKKFARYIVGWFLAHTDSEDLQVPTAVICKACSAHV